MVDSELFRPYFKENYIDEAQIDSYEDDFDDVQVIELYKMMPLTKQKLNYSLVSYRTIHPLRYSAFQLLRYPRL